MTTSTTITADNVSAWNTDLASVQDKLQAIDLDLVDVTAPALAGDPDAQARREALLSERSTLDRRRADLASAIDSGRQHIQRQAEAEAEQQRQRAAEEEQELREKQLGAARRFDRCLQGLSKAWTDYRRLSVERAAARRRAGLPSISRDLEILARISLWQSYQLSKDLGLPVGLRTHAKPLEDQV